MLDSTKYLLTNAQKRIWNTEKLLPNTGLSAPLFSLKLQSQTGSIDYGLLKNAILLLIERNPSLRTQVFGEDESEQYFRSSSVADLKVIDGSTMDVDSYILVESRKIMTLNDLDLVQIRIILISQVECVILFRIHHIICDGYTMELIAKEIMDIYDGLLRGSVPSQIRPSYIEFIKSESEYENSDRFVQDREFWLQEFQSFSYDSQDILHGKRSVCTAGERKSFFIAPEMHDDIRRFGDEHKITTFTMFFSALHLYLYKVTSNNDQVIGTYYANRTNANEQEMLGMFVSTVPFRMPIEGKQDVLSFIQAVSEKKSVIAKHQKYPFNLLVHELRQNYNYTNPLFRVAMNFQRSSIFSNDLFEYELDLVFGGHEENELLVRVQHTKAKKHLRMDFDYRTNLFSDDDITLMYSHISNLIQQIIQDPHQSIDELDLLTPDERTKLLIDFNDTKASYPKDKTIHALFEEQAERTQDQVAVLFGAEALTYRELNERANRLARTLRAEGVGPDQPVGILVQRSLEMIVGIYAILKAGGAYVPIDPDYPVDRIRFMLEDSEAKLVLTQSRLVEQATLSFGGKVLVLDSEEIHHEDGSNLEPLAGPWNVAYVIYTSGSTGKPKGVMVEHHSVINRILWMHDRYGLSAGDTILQKTAFTFDVSVWELFWWSMVGSKVSLLSIGGEKNPEDIVEAIAHGRVSTMHFVPAMLHAFLEYVEQQPLEVVQAKLGTLRHVFASGETLPPQHVVRFQRLVSSLAGAKLINLYGPTEATVDVSYFDCEPNEEYAVIPIGKPIQNIRLYIVKEGTKQLQPIGVAGELCISGVGVARGYLNRPELTAEKFVDNPFEPSERMYRTGDLARWLPDGNLEYMGRIDEQVKIRGYRIETGEIVYRLLKHTDVKEAVVVARKDEDDEAYLCAYVVSGGAFDASELRAYLRESLPDYMVPSYLVEVERIPLTANGKVNRKALPEPQGLVQAGSEYVAPRNETEEALAAIWQDVLRIGQVGIQDNFFEIGGDSMKAIRLSARMKHTIGQKANITHLFRYPTIEFFLANLSSCANMPDHTAYESIPIADEREYYPVSSAQKRMYILSQLEGGEISYNMPEVIAIKGPLHFLRLQEAFQGLIQRHESLRTSFELRNGEPVQLIHDKVEFSVEYTKAGREKKDELIQNFVRPFDFEKAPLMRVGVVELGSDDHLVVFDMHHIIFDGESMNIFMKELFQLYEGKTLEPLRIQYRDYAVWQQGDMQSEQMKSQEAYWLEVFHGELPILEMPTDFVRPSERNFLGETHQFVIDEERSRRLKQMAVQMDSTLYMVLLSAYTILLSKYSGQEDIIVGSPVAGREHADLENTIGMFVNTLALRNEPLGEKLFSEYVQDVKENVLRAFENMFYPFEEMVEKLNLKRDRSRNPLFDTMFVLQNMDQMPSPMNELQLSSYVSEHTVAKMDLALLVEERGGQICCSFEYATALYTQETIQRMAGHLLQLIDKVLNHSEAKISTLEIITSPEREQIIEEFAGTFVEYPHDQTIHQLFEEQVERTPEQIALVFEDRQLTYRELNDRSNQIARTLQKAGVSSNQLIGIMTERSLEMVIGLLAILKAGGAYVPVDPDYPEERIEYIVKNSRVKLLLGQQHLVERVSYVEKISLDDPRSFENDASNLKKGTEPNQLAYVIYTSGTTGEPKGVMVEHSSILNTILWKKECYGFSRKDRVLMMTPYVFDAFITHFFGPIVSGATVILLNDEKCKDPMAIKSVVASQKITHLQSPPSFLMTILENMNPEDMSFVTHVTIGGDKATPTLIQKLTSMNDNVVIYNEYGPTENSVVSTFLLITSSNQKISIGKPITNTSVYIVDKSDHLLPIGVIGELCVAGAGMARGYLNHSELTVEKFVTNPFCTKERMYRTGDLARWLPDGNIEYVGRMDFQIKIMGNRIETGEIESALLSIDEIQEAVVIAVKDEQGMNKLCAYFVADDRMTVVQIRNELSKWLPSYMIPAYFVRLAKMPLTTNSKIDRKALLAIPVSIESGVEYVAPRTKVEELLVEIWQAVLGVAKVGVADNFFDLGGDSIKSIQVSSRLFQAGYQVSMKQLFKYPTVVLLSQHVEPISRNIEQGEVTGSATLTPIQHWFYENFITEAHHFNQSFMLYREQRVDEAALAKVMTKVLEHHDVLRTVYRPTASGYEAWNRGTEDGKLFSLDVVDLRAEPNSAEVIEAKANQIQASIDITQGPLVKLGLFTCTDGDHLLIVIHHLVVDGVSWRILLEDISSGYDQALAGKEIQLPQKTDSFKLWAEQLSQYANSEEAKQELAYWKQIEGGETGSLPKDYDRDCGLVKDSETITVEWTAQETEQLVKQTHRAYHTEINDLLLTALGMAVHKWTGMEKIVVNLEGHGREQILPELDITRTVGWFTSQYPVILQIEADQNISKHVKRTKEGLRQIPNKGIGYGILRYLSAFPDIHPYTVQPEISFNYLGQFDQDLQNNDVQISSYSGGQTISGNQSKLFPLEINGGISKGVLSFTVTYSRNQYRMETMQQLTELLRANLQQVIGHCVTKEEAESTPSDFSLINITMEELDQLVEQTRHIGAIENVYPLTPMQKGMLFHHLLEPQSRAYFQQSSFEVHGSVNVDSFVNSLKILMRKHAVFRTNFYSELLDLPVQVVYQDKKPECAFLDLRGRNAAQREEMVRGYKRSDMEKGFDLAQDNLMRMSIIRLEEEKYLLIWSFHHIVMDGWCSPLIFKELFDTYYTIQQSRQPMQTKETPYSHFIEWLVNQNPNEASSYWLDYLSGYEGQTVLPKKNSQEIIEGYVSGKVDCKFDEELTQRIKQTTTVNRVTINTLMQATWGILLQKYNNSEDVVFGTVVSGRREEIPGIETMIGLFINTIPVRIHCEAEETFTEVMKRIQETAILSHQYDMYPLYEIQANVDLQQQLISNIMIFENYPVEQQKDHVQSDEQDVLRIGNVMVEEQTNYDFNVIVDPEGEMKVEFSYNANMYDHASVMQIKEHFIQIMKQVVGDPYIRMKDITLLTELEKKQIIYEFNDTTAEYPSEKTISHLFEEQVDLVPEQIAVVFENKQLTYRELNERANQLARTLRAEGLQADQLVGIMMDRSAEMLIGIVAILKAGGAYVPIDPKFPSYLLENSCAKLLLANQYLHDRVSFNGKRIILDDVQSYHDDCSNLECILRPTDLAYIIFTSGTTGKPKGVMVEHRNVVRLVKNTNYVGLNQRTCILQTGSLVFDALTFEMWGALLNGGRVCFVEKEAVLDEVRMKNVIEQLEINTMFITTALFNQLSKQDSKWLGNLKRVLVGGEMLSLSIINQVLQDNPNIKLANIYGPTENTTFSTWYPLETEQTEDVPIGRPIRNSTAYVVDKWMNLQPVGVWGELLVSGDGVARGYLNQPELTKEKFVECSFLKSGQRGYRTGDLVRWTADGLIEIKGRIDHQVKIRGFRIELGEVEAALLRLDSIGEAIVIAREDEDGLKQLCAYYVGDNSVTVGQIKHQLSQELPSHMVPAYLIKLDKMPLTQNGKIDRKALPLSVADLHTGSSYVAPRTLIEDQMAKIWKEVLGLSKISINDNFFDVGGHSLRATTLVAKLHKEMGYHISVKDLFRHPTIEEISGVISGKEQQAYASIPVADEREHYPVSSAQKRMYLLSQVDGGELSYNITYRFSINGPLDRGRLEAAFQSLIRRHESLRTGFEIVDGEPMQRIYPEVEFTVEQFLVGEHEVRDCVRSFARSFDFEKAPLMRVGLLELNIDHHILLLDMHHIISDGVSMNILMNEFSQLYEGNELLPISIHYKDYAVWQQSEIQSNLMQKQEEYWLEVLSGEIPQLDMPMDYERPSVRAYEGDIVEVVIDDHLIQGVREIEIQTESTQFMILFAAYTILLAKYSGQDDIIIGTPIAGRNHADLDGIIGMFVNTLAIRSAPSGEKTFIQYVNEVKENMLRAYEHQSYPFDLLMQKVNSKKDASRNAIFDTMFTLQNIEAIEFAINSLTFEEYKEDHSISKFDLSLYVTLDNRQVKANFEYCIKLFSRELIALLSQDYVSILSSVCQDPCIKISDIKLSEKTVKASSMLDVLEFLF
ncbi:amino acid adenylation domain-containing protein [Paenibacillus polymyxa]|nr:amino acid adenylation domain-containing protein [Paenibacillus polymyxa]